MNIQGRGRPWFRAGASVLVVLAVVIIAGVVGTCCVLGVWPVEEPPVVVETPYDAVARHAPVGRAEWEVLASTLPDSLKGTR